MSKHIHAEAIKTWADNTRLSRLIRSDGTWELGNTYLHDGVTWYKNWEYFLVEPEHVEIALAWKNGAKIQKLYSNGQWKRTETPAFEAGVDYRVKRWEPAEGELSHYYHNEDDKGQPHRGVLRLSIGKNSHDGFFIASDGCSYPFCEPLKDVGLVEIES